MVNYGRSRPEEVTGAISAFLSVSSVEEKTEGELMLRTATIGTL
jgi:hypothetical protein